MTIRKITNENSNNFRRVKKALWGDPSGKIKTFAIISPENPLGWKDATDDELKDKYLKWSNQKGQYNQEMRDKLKAELIPAKVTENGDRTLRIGGFTYVQIKGSYGDREKTFMIFNIPFEDAREIARSYGQESFFFGKVDAEYSTIGYYLTTNACATYKRIELSRTISTEDDATDFFSKFGCKFRINMREFGDNIPEVEDNGEFEESMNGENSTFMSRQAHRKNAYRKS